MTRSRAPGCDSRSARAALPHAIANGLASAEGDFVAIDGEVPLHLEHQIRIRQTNPVPRGWAIQIGIDAARKCCGSCVLLQLVRRLRHGDPTCYGSRQRQPARQLSRRPARSAPLFRKGYRGACRKQPPDQTGALDSLHRSGSGCPPERGGRPCAAPPRCATARPLLITISSSASRYSPGCMPVLLPALVYWIGSCRVTSFVPSGKVASACTSWIMPAHTIHHFIPGEDRAP